MKRGLSLVLMAAAIGMASVLIPPVVFTLLVVFMYSFFDTFNLRAQISMGTAPEDDYLVHFDPQDKRLARMMMDSHKLVGWCLIAIGALIAYEQIIMNTLGDILWRWGSEGSGMAGHLSGDGSTARGRALRGTDPVRHLAGAGAPEQRKLPRKPPPRRRPIFRSISLKRRCPACWITLPARQSRIRPVR